ncbi:MAG: hypothetical protein JWP03_5213 [Phycisphaerales bacterium]|jgi:hypothetical protein|nr:hypothetical protein [Phycisphaerales bacterium]
MKRGHTYLTYAMEHSHEGLPSDSTDGASTN